MVVQPYHTEVGAGTFNPATFLRCLDARPWRAAYVEPSMRPADGRYGENPYRLGHYYQYQVVIKPSPADIQDVYLRSLEALGIVLADHDVRFVEDNWEGPTLGAWGQGWEVWVDGMEATQFTYFQQLGGFDLDPITIEITYGLERLAMYLQGVDSVYDLVWSRWEEDGADARRHLRRRLPGERARVQPLQLRGGGHRDAVPPLPRARGRGAARHRGAPAHPRLRPRAQVQPRVQHARRARRDQRHRPHGAHRPRARPRAPGRRPLPGGRRRRARGAFRRRGGRHE